MNTEPVVLCMRWGSLYGPDYVNVLYRAVKEHLEDDFRFVCLTNETDGIDSTIETYPIPNFGLEERHWYDGAWPKLSVFQQDLYGLTGRCLFIDLDTMILSDLSPFFEVKGEIVAIDAGRNWRKSAKVGAPEAGTGIFAFDLGQMGYLFDGFVQDRDGHIARDKIEQVYVQHMARDMTFWSDKWVQSFKYHARGPALSGLFTEPVLPKTAKVLAFHGNPRPVDLLNKTWGQFPHIGRGPVTWVKAYWDRYL